MITDRIIDKKVKGILEKAGAQIGLRYNEETRSLLGVYNGYHISCAYINNVYDIKVSVRKDGQLPEAALCKSIKKSIREIWDVKVRDNVVIANPTGATTGRTIKAIVATIKGLTEAFRMNGFEDACEVCGQSHINLDSYYISGTISTLCEECYEKITQPTEQLEQPELLEQSTFEENNVKENVLFGIVGAFLGSLIGVACIIIISQLGYVASISGLVMSVCTVYGYSMLAKDFSFKGAIISLIMMIVMTYFADKASWCISIAKNSDLSFVDSFKNFKSILEFTKTEKDFSSDLSRVYLYEVFGNIPIILAFLGGHKKNTGSHKIQ